MIGMGADNRLIGQSKNCRLTSRLTELKPKMAAKMAKWLEIKKIANELSHLICIVFVAIASFIWILFSRVICHIIEFLKLSYTSLWAYLTASWQLWQSHRFH